MRGRDKVRLQVTEEQKKVPHEPTAKELREKEAYPHSRRIPKFDAVPTGKLTLVPGGVIDLSSEEALGQLIEKATRDVLQLLDEEQRRRELEEAEQRRAWEKQQREQNEKARVDALYKAAAEFRQYRDLMEYIEEVRRFGKAPANQRQEGQSLEEWLKWAEWCTADSPTWLI